MKSGSCDKNQCFNTNTHTYAKRGRIIYAEMPFPAASQRSTDRKLPHPHHHPPHLPSPLRETNTPLALSVARLGQLNRAGV